MSRHLRANTQTIVQIGPFVDVTDGFTPETGIVLTGGGAADEAELFKHGASTTTDISAATWAAITGADGYYALTLTTSHTDTEGNLVIVVQDDSVCLPVRNEFSVLSQAAYDSLYATKAAGFMDVNIKTVGRIDTQETEADNLEAACAAYSTTRGLSGTALPAAAADAAGGLPISDAGGLDLDTKLANTNEVTAARMGALTDWIDGGRLDLIIDNILVDTGTTLQAELDGIQADTEDIQTRLPAALVGGRIDATVDGTGMETGALDAIADAVWDELQSGHVSAGSFGEVATEVAAILVDTGTDGVVVASIATDAISAAAMSTAAAQEVADALLDRASAVDTYTPREALRLTLAALAGKMSGAGTGTEVFRSASDAKARITATTDASGNRSAITLDATA